MKCFKCKQGELEVVEENGKKYARCNNCGIALTANDLQTIASQRQSIHQASEEKKGNGLKIGLIIGGVFLVLFVLVGAVAVINIGSSPSEVETDTTNPTKALTKTEENNDKADISETDNKKDVSFDFSRTDIPFGEQDIDGLEIQNGNLLSVIYNSGIVVIKAKIKPSFSNKATIDQNYFNVADLIKKHGFNTCNELQYWAVADMSDGDESKCISFTLDKTTIDGLYNENIVENQLGDYVTDLWILPSLQN